MGEVIQFPTPKKPPVKEPEGPVATLIISDGVFSVPGHAMPYPSAPAVDSRYMKALEEQRKKDD